MVIQQDYKSKNMGYEKTGVRVHSADLPDDGGDPPLFDLLVYSVVSTAGSSLTTCNTWLKLIDWP